MPGGYALAEAFVRIRPDATGFRAEATAAIKSAVAGLKAAIPISVELTKTSVAAMRQTVKTALAGVTGKIDVGVSKSSLTAMRVAVSKALAGLLGYIDVRVTKASLVQARVDIKDALNTVFPINVRVTQTSLAALRRDVKAALDGVSVKLAGLTALQAGLAKITAASGGTGRAGNNLIAIWGRWGGLTANAIHWIITGFLELAAVIVPATAAAIAWAAVWLQGTTNVVTHINSVYTATEAMANMSHVTAGQMLGLGNSLQKAQDAANPDVYQALGGAIHLVNQQSGAFVKAGLAAGKVFDTFVAKLNYDFSKAGGAGKTMGKIFANMVPDLVKIGQVFGNLGHAAGLVAGSMPGLAEVLLGFVSMITRGINDVVTFANKITFMGHNIFFLAIAVEEFMRWGGLMVNLMGRMGIATTDLGTRLFSWQKLSGVFKSLALAIPNAAAAIVGGLGGLLAKLGATGSKAEAAGLHMQGLATKMETVLADIPLWQVAVGVVAVAALGFLIYKIVTAKSAAQKFADSLQTVVNKATNLQVLTVIADSMTVLQSKIQNNNAAITRWTGSIQQAGAWATKAGVSVGKSGLPYQALAQNISNAADANRTFSAAQRQLAGESINVLANSAMLAREYHTTIPGAMALAQEAGVKLTGNIRGQGEAAFIARQKVANLVQGYNSMGQPLSVVGNDMTAVAIAAGEQNSKISQVTQAWTSFMQTLTTGTNDLAGFQNSLKNLVAGTASFAHNLGRGGGGLTGAVQQFAADLTNSGKKGSQAWQNFDQVVGQTAPDLINWLSTAGSMGVISGGKFVQAAKDMIAQLLPFAAKSKTAQAELAGLIQMAGGPFISSFQGMVKWVGNVRNPTKDLQKIIGETTQKMADMSKVAQNLGTVLQTQLVDMMDKARLSASGVQGAMVTYTYDLQHNTALTSAGQSARQKLIHDLQLTGMNSKSAHQYVDALTQSVKGNTYTTNAGHQNRAQLISDIKGVINNAPNATGDLRNFTTKILGYTQSAQKGHITRAQLIQDIIDTGSRAHLTTGDIATMIGKILGIPKSRALAIMMNAHGSGNISFAQQILGQNSKGFLSFHAAGALVKGAGSGDTVPAMLTPGEAVVPKHLVPAVAPFLGAHHVPGFAAGGFVESGPHAASDLGSSFTGLYGAFNNRIAKSTDQIMQGFVQASKKAVSAMATGSGGGSFGAGAAGGSGAANAALARRMMPSWGSGSEWNAWNAVAMAESGWNSTIMNASSGALGIAQALGHGVSGGSGTLGNQYGGFGLSLAGDRAANSGNAGSQIAWMINYIKCVPLSTHILTQRGWLSHDDVQLGDMTIGYNAASGRSEWTPITAVHHYEDAPLVTLRNKTWEATCTPGHRWMSKHVYQDDRQPHRPDMKSWLADEFVTTDQITSRHSLRLAAPAHTGSGPAISDGEAELLGWVMGDGSVQAYATRAGAGDELGELIRGLGARYPGASFRAIARMAGCTHQTAAAYLRGSGMPGGHVRTGSGSMVRISLSQAKPDGVTAIDALLAREDVQASRHARLPQGIAGLELVTWRLRASYSAELLKRSGYNHKDPVLFVLSLSPSQREAFLRGVFGAEGCLDRGHRVYTQADGPQQDSIAVALYLSGKRPAMRHWSDSSRRSLGKTCSPGANIGETSPFIGGGAIRREACDPAPVWCVSTELGSWTARQSGQVFLTGNSQYGDPLGAAAHESAYHWYDQGGWLPPGRSLAINNTGRPERVLGPREGTVIHVRVDPVIAAVTPDRRLGQRIAQHILMATKGGQRLFPAGVTPR